MTVFNMDTLTPHGSEVACSWCDFATRPLANAHTFRLFKLHLYVRWPTPSQCVFGSTKMAVNDVYVSFGIGSASSDLSTIYGYQYRDYSYGILSREVTVLDFTVSGYDVNVGKEVSVGIDTGKRLVVHFGVAAPFFDPVRKTINDTVCVCDYMVQSVCRRKCDGVSYDSLR